MIALTAPQRKPKAVSSRPRLYFDFNSYLARFCYLLEVVELRQDEEEEEAEGAARI